MLYRAAQWVLKDIGVKRHLCLRDIYKLPKGITVKAPNISQQFVLCVKRQIAVRASNPFAKAYLFLYFSVHKVGQDH